MITAGVHKASVIMTEFDNDDKGQEFIRVQFGIEDLAGGHDTIPAKIYLTDASMGIARNRLKAMGFDVDARSTKELKDNPVLLAGNIVEILIVQNGSYMNVDRISVPKQPKEEGFFDKLDAALRAAKGKKNAPAPAAGGGPAAPIPGPDDKDIPF